MDVKAVNLYYYVNLIASYMLALAGAVRTMETGSGGSCKIQKKGYRPEQEVRVVILKIVAGRCSLPSQPIHHIAGTAVPPYKGYRSNRPGHAACWKGMNELR
jgi:hypothetical protein